jgi:peptidoglycan/xylan/chitin deacetylase (PgdA/CDA1 family)
MQLGLKVDVDTLRGTREGVPALVSALRDAGAGATFLFSLGPDHTGRAIRRVFRPGFLGKVSRTSVVGHYGIRSLLYGTLLPGPDISGRAGREMQAVRAAGFEVGVHCHDHTLWQDYVTRRDATWTARQMQLAVDAFTRVFGEPPRTHGAAGWQMNSAAFRLEETLGFDYASDTRGDSPFLPVIDGQASRCPQLPTTLPTLDELIGVDGVTEAGAPAKLLELTAQRRPGHVFTLHAELEGQRLKPRFLELLAGWRRQGYQLVALRTLWQALAPESLPRCAVSAGTLPGRSGTLALQVQPA